MATYICFMTFIFLNDSHLAEVSSCWLFGRKVTPIFVEWALDAILMLDLFVELI